MFKFILSALFCLSLLSLAPPQSALADKLLERLTNVEHSVGQKLNTLDNAIIQLNNANQTAWEKQMKYAQTAVEQKNFARAEDALQMAENFAKIGSKDSRLIQTVQAKTSCLNQHYDYLRHSPPLIFIPDTLYRTLTALAFRSKDLIDNIGIAISFLLFLWVLVSVFGHNNAMAFGISEVLNNLGFKKAFPIVLFVIAIIFIVGSSCWILSAINQSEEIKINSVQYQKRLDAFSLGQPG